MKSIFNLFRICVIASLGLTTIVSCEKNTLDNQYSQSEYFAKIHTLEIQQTYLLSALENSFDSLILPIGVVKNWQTKSPNYKSYQINFGSGKLCGDYIQRRGQFLVEEFFVKGLLDSISCQFTDLDSFGVITDKSTLFFEGYMGLKIHDETTLKLSSSLNIQYHSNIAISFVNQSVVKRLLKSPVKIQFEDGLEFSGNSEIRDNMGQFNLSSHFEKLIKGIDAPNFPISGYIETVLNTNKTIRLDFDAFNNFAFDKLAKGSEQSTEWIFDIQ